MESREEGSCCLSERSQMINTEALYGWSTSIILPDCRYDANRVSFIKRFSSFWTCHVSQSFMKVLIWGNLNLKCYKFLSIKTLHVTVNVVAACLIWLVCLINMDVDEISADRILWVSDEYQILNVFMLFCTRLLQGLIFHSYQSQCVNPS